MVDLGLPYFLLMMNNYTILGNCCGRSWPPLYFDMKFFNCTYSCEIFDGMKGCCVNGWYKNGYYIL